MRFFKDLLISLVLTATTSHAMENITPPLTRAIYRGNFQLAIQLIDQGADVNQTDRHGNTLLIWAIILHHESIAKLLIARGASVNKLNHSGVTALWFAFRPSQISIFRFLLEHDASVFAKDKKHLDALELLASRGDNSYGCELIVEHLLKKQKKLTDQIVTFILCAKQLRIFPKDVYVLIGKTLKKVVETEDPDASGAYCQVQKLPECSIKQHLIEKYFTPKEESQARWCAIL